MDQPIRFERILPVEGKPTNAPQAKMSTLRIDAGRTDKLRPGDIVGGAEPAWVGPVTSWACTSGGPGAGCFGQDGLGGLRLTDLHDGRPSPDEDVRHLTAIRPRGWLP